MEGKKTFHFISVYLSIYSIYSILSDLSILSFMHSALNELIQTNLFFSLLSLLFLSHLVLFSPPPNESLTAYGLLEFNDMSQVYPVDKALIPRVQEWLMSRRSPQGGFLRGSGRYGFGNAPEDITNAYICWALTEGMKNQSNLISVN